MPQIVWTARADGHHDSFNRRWSEYTGMATTDSAGDGWTAALHPDDLDETRARWRHAHTTGAPYEVQYRLRRADGVYHWHLARALPRRDDADQVLRWVGTCTDIDEQKRTEDALRFLAGATPVLSASLDYAQALVSVARLAVPRLADFCAVDVLGPGGAPQRLAAVHVDPARVALVEELGRREHLVANDRCEPATVLRTGASRLREAVDDELECDAPTRRLLRELGVRSSMCVAIHGRGRPIGAITLGTCSEGLLGEDKQRRGLETIERSARAQTQLIDDLLDISRIISGKLRLDPRPIDPVDPVLAAFEAVLPAAEARGVRMTRVLATSAEAIVADPDRLQQIVWNLLTNAVQFTQRGGSVHLRLRRVDSHCEIHVEDSGQGIPPQFLRHVFELFRQADADLSRKHGGLGIGLAITRHLVELHGGTIEARSGGEGEGAQFLVRLPIAPIRASEAARGGPDFECPPELAGLRVLVVDDEPDVRELLVAVLEHCRVEVRAVASAAEALAAVPAFRPDVLVSDIGMPGEDGYELVRKLRALPVEAGGRLPALALTAFARTEDRARALLAGFQMHISKPLDPSELMVVLANLSGRVGGPPVPKDSR
jgi:PAS domain S-box-containing protein